ncbi:ABC transporter permease [Kocuria sp. SM24M-10]|uniref:ABC transporter permease n=1 Tax=Kocuria sp. SM24M-10 TaxID=1660349 RepID=UPI00064B08B7|nr:ABC transporter permease [Kocuria sp. SM24M-10]KLU10537.1 ABC transporter permease [Kocuria sp. SM24M-10]
MTWTDMVGSAVASTFRGRTRTLLTVVAVFIGALTLTLTSGMGTGVNRYIDQTVAAFGDTDALYVQKSQPLLELSTGTGPRAYDPEDTQVATGFGVSFAGLTEEDVTTVEDTPGVTEVHPVYNVVPTYLRADGARFQLALGIPVDGEGLQVVAGATAADGADELAIPDSWVADLGFASAEDAVGEVLEVVMTNMAGTEQAFEATVSGVTQANLAGVAMNPLPSTSFNERLYAYQISGGPEEVAASYIMARAVMDDPAQAPAVQERLEEAGMVASTVEDQLGMFRTVIDAVIWILNTCAVIALLAASLGIVNTLLMSVQERIREIGLMKALGTSGAKVFGLFSLEAVFIGLLGAVLGVTTAVVAGSWVARWLAEGFLAGLPGLSLFVFRAPEIALIAVAVLTIAFAAGTIPAVRAAGKDPITALRHE